MSQLSDLTERFLQLQRGNVQLEDQLRGTGFLPEGYTSTVGQQTGPQGFGENLANFFGLHKDTRTKDLLEQAKSNRSLLVQAQRAMLAAQKDKVTAEGDATREKVRTESATDLQQQLEAIRDIYADDRAGRLDELRLAGQLSTDQSIAQAQALLPYVDAATAKAVERNLDASMRDKAFKEQLPSSIQAIMESKQRQQQLASDAFAREAGAIATQQQAATGFAGVGTGRRFG